MQNKIFTQSPPRNNCWLIQVCVSVYKQWWCGKIEAYYKKGKPDLIQSLMKFGNGTTAFI